MRFQGNFKIAAIAALGVLLLASIAGAAVFALTTLRDTTEDTPAAVVGETAGAAVAPVQTVGSVASGPLDAEPAAANVATPTPEPATATPTATPEPATPTPTPTPNPPPAPTMAHAMLNSCAAGPSCSVTLTWVSSMVKLDPTGFEANMSLADGTGSPVESGTLPSGTASYTFTLSAYGEYTAKVRAVKGASASDWASTTVAVADPPATIASVSVSRSDAALTLSWTVPNDGGMPIVSYEAGCSVDNGTNWSLCGYNIAASGDEGDEFTTTLTEVDNDASYTVRVRASNAAATGAWTESAQVGPYGLPGLASDVTADRDGYTIAASWTAGFNVASYNVNLMKWTPDQLTYKGTVPGVTGTTASFTLASDAFNDSHVVTVTSTNQYGISDPVISSVIAPPTPPALVASVSGTRPSNGTSIVVSWSAVADATHYHLNYTNDDGESWHRYASDIPASSTTLTMTGLDKSRAYILAVQSSAKYVGNNETTVLQWGWRNSPKIHTPPGKPTNLSVSFGSGSANTKVTWYHPTFTGTGSDSVTYNVYCRSSSSNSWSKVKSGIAGSSTFYSTTWVSDSKCKGSSGQVGVTAVNEVESEMDSIANF